MNTARFRSQRGATAAIVAICLVLLLGFLAAALDMGFLWAVRGQVQTAADSASLAAARALQSCDAPSQDRAAALVAAQNAMTQNPVAKEVLGLDDADVIFGRYYPFGSGPEHEFVPGNSNPNSVKVTVHKDESRNGPVQLTFGVILGISHVDVAAGAIASRDRRVIGFSTPGGTFGKLIPFVGQASSMPPVGGQVKFFPASPQTGPGNWGLIDLVPDGTGFTTTYHAGDSTIASQIANGYSGTVKVDPDTGAIDSGRTGTLGGSIASALNSRIGDTVIIANYDSADGTGTNLIYHISGFTAVRIDSVQVTGALANRAVWATVVPTSDATAITDPNATENCSISKLVLSR